MRSSHWWLFLFRHRLRLTTSFPPSRHQQPTNHLLPGIRDRILVVTTQQMKVRMAMHGIARQTGTRGSATLPPIRTRAIGPRKNRCIRYIPNDISESFLISFGVSFLSMLENRRKAPKDARSTFGVQNSQDHSRRGVSMVCPGVPIYQNDHPVNAAPASRHKEPAMSFFFRFQSR